MASTNMITHFSIVIPAKNEAQGLSELLPAINKLHPTAELIVVNDGSTDATATVAKENGAIVINHPYSKGNGASIKSGTERASADTIVFMDADGQHKPQDIARLINEYEKGFDLVIGARKGLASQANIFRGGANSVYNKFASLLVGQKIQDLTSGFRIVKAALFRRYLFLLPNGFSYPTTSTMAFFRAGHSVGFIEITANKRIGKSHIKLFKDGTRFFLIIFKIATLYSPLKVFIPTSFTFFCLGSLHYLNTYISSDRFTNMSALLYIASILIFLMGLISEQITNLMYSGQQPAQTNDSRANPKH